MGENCEVKYVQYTTYRAFACMWKSILFLLKTLSRNPELTLNELRLAAIFQSSMGERFVDCFLCYNCFAYGGFASYWIVLQKCRVAYNFWVSKH